MYTDHHSVTAAETLDCRKIFHRRERLPRLPQYPHRPDVAAWLDVIEAANRYPHIGGLDRVGKTGADWSWLADQHRPFQGCTAMMSGSGGRACSSSSRVATVVPTSRALGRGVQGRWWGRLVRGSVATVEMRALGWCTGWPSCRGLWARGWGGR